jgi:hypothetical protein
MIDVDGQKRLKVTYTYDDDVVFGKGLEMVNKEFWLPKDRSQIYKLNMVGEAPKCTDDHYQSEGDFWYFWNPDKAGCPETFKSGLNRVKAKFAPIPNTLGRYPLYGKLGANGKRVVYVAHGGYEDLKEASDAGVQAFATTLAELVRMGFKETSKTSDTAAFKHYVYSKDDSALKTEIHVALFMSNSKEFTAYGREGLENADVFIYNGHSGLGGHLPPTRFAPLKLPNKYQVFVFNGCSTFAYYNETYFAKKEEATGKPGAESLDVVTSSLEILFATQPYVTSSIINDIVVGGDKLKWEDIITNLGKQGKRAGPQFDKEKYAAMYQVNGDEDNPTSLDAALKK